MAIREVAILNGRALAASTWILESAGYDTLLGPLYGGPAKTGQKRKDVARQALSWAERYAKARPGTIDDLTPTTVGMSERPALQSYIEGLGTALSSWLSDSWPNPVQTTEPIAYEHLLWLLGHRPHASKSELFLIVPFARMTGFRIGKSTYAVSRDLVNTAPVFHAWARQRTKLNVQPLMQVSEADESC